MSRSECPASVVDHNEWPFRPDPDFPSSMIDTIEHDDPTVRALVIERHAPLLAKLRPWERATGYHAADDAEITLAMIFRHRRAYMDAGWDTRLIADETEPFVLWLEVRPAPGCAKPYFGSPLRMERTDEDALARFREHDGDEFSADAAQAEAPRA